MEVRSNALPRFQFYWWCSSEHLLCLAQQLRATARNCCMQHHATVAYNITQLLHATSRNSCMQHHATVACNITQQLRDVAWSIFSESLMTVTGNFQSPISRLTQSTNGQLEFSRRSHESRTKKSQCKRPYITYNATGIQQKLFTHHKIFMCISWNIYVYIMKYSCTYYFYIKRLNVNSPLYI